MKNNENMTATINELTNDFTAKLNALEKARADGLNYDDQYTAARKAKDALNKAIKEKAAKRLARVFDEAGAEAFWSDYINDKTADAWSLVQNKDSKAFYADASKQRVPYKYICHMSKKAIPTNGAYRRFIQIMVHNINRASITNTEKDAPKTWGSTESLPLSLQGDIKKLGKDGQFWNKCNDASITKQYNAIVRMMYPGGMAPNYYMLSSDTLRIKQMVSNYKDEIKATGEKFITMSTDRVENYIITAISGKINGVGAVMENKELEKMNKKEGPAPADNSPAAPMLPVTDTAPIENSTTENENETTAA